MNGKPRTYWHKSLQFNKGRSSKEVMNVYIEDVSKSKKQALIFYEYAEVSAMAKYLSNTFEKSEIISIS